MKVTVVCERNDAIMGEYGLKAYPEILDVCLKNLFESAGHEVTTVIVKGDEYGAKDLTDEIIENTEVMVWWAHATHWAVQDEIAIKVCNRVHRGMGLICLHSAHVSKVFKGITGSSGTLKWRDGDTEVLWTVDPLHPICKGIPEHVVIPEDEMYGEPFGIPTPDELVFMGWFSGGEVFRSGCVFNRGLGRMFYFQPGHETNPTYHIPEIRQILLNAVEYVSPRCEIKEHLSYPHTEPVIKK